LIKERASFFPYSIDPADTQPLRSVYLQRLNAHLLWLGQLLADGRAFMLGAEPSAADLAAYHPIWFARQNGGPEIEALLPLAAVGSWYDRVAAIGHGKATPMTPEEAIRVARDGEPADAAELSNDGTRAGLRIGDWVSVTPDDYGNAVHGRLMAFRDEEIVLRHEDPTVGRVNLRFPRAGFDVAAVRRAA
jgi:hypothetical protein